MLRVKALWSLTLFPLVVSFEKGILETSKADVIKVRILSLHNVIPRALSLCENVIFRRKCRLWKQLLPFKVCPSLPFLFFSYFPSHSHTPLLLPFCLFLFHGLSPLCLLFPFLSPSCSLFFSLVSLEVLNKERASLPFKLVGKSRLKLRGTAQRSGIFGTTGASEGRRRH